tara:strand:- start:434 stop:646 length:213 start_codon:yes stop_codon:yes gene_type:complete
VECQKIGGKVMDFIDFPDSHRLNRLKSAFFRVFEGKSGFFRSQGALPTFPLNFSSGDWILSADVHQKSNP